MPINLMTKYAEKLAERYTLNSKTDAYCGKDFDFVGVKGIEVLTATTYAPNTYTRNGQNRFGTTQEVEDIKQTMIMQEVLSNSLSIDEANASEQYNVKSANRMMKAQWDEQYTPTIDSTRLAKWANGNGLSDGFSVLSNTSPAALSKGNIVNAIFDASAEMSDNKVPAINRAMWISEKDFNHFKLADVVLGGAQLNEKAIRQGFKGTIDGIRVITVPSVYMPEGVGFIIKHKGATVDPVKNKVLRVHKNPPGINGDLMEFLIMYDSFVLDSKCKGVYVYKTA